MSFKQSIFYIIKGFKRSTKSISGSAYLPIIGVSGRGTLGAKDPLNKVPLTLSIKIAQKPYIAGS